ncbi:MAG TPA: CoA pyrophosphatase [Actinomycetota bacterium]|nr:CoA pyrophosphatase [Actinomycetota bacterium]
MDTVRESLRGVRHPDDPQSRRRAAVLVALFEDDGVLRVVLTKRASTLSRHQGEISFPGGISDPDDPTPLDTALREAREEIGLDPAVVDVLGPLDALPTSSSGYLILPFVGWIPWPCDLSADAREVERILTPPLEAFGEGSGRRVEHWERHGAVYPMYFFDVEGEVVWGATSRLLVALHERLEGRTPELALRPRQRPEPASGPASGP